MVICKGSTLLLPIKPLILMEVCIILTLLQVLIIHLGFLNFLAIQ